MNMLIFENILMCLDVITYLHIYIIPEKYVRAFLEFTYSFIMVEKESIN
jgi:hypothetical protein